MSVGVSLQFVFAFRSNRKNTRISFTNPHLDELQIMCKKLMML